MHCSLQASRPNGPLNKKNRTIKTLLKRHPGHKLVEK